MTETKQALDAVVALVEKWRAGARHDHALAKESRDNGERDVAALRLGYSTVQAECADDLALLLPALRSALTPTDWQPTPEAINALPEPLRAYIHRIETSHPSYDNAVRIRQLEEQVEQLQAALGEAAAAWTDAQCLEFASVAFRHAPKNLPAGVTLADIRMGAQRAAAIDAMAAGEDAK